MTMRDRFILGAIGLLSWLAGGIAAFVSPNGAGAAALVAGGALAGAIGAIGRWPSRVSVSGNEVTWDEVKETVDSQIKVAKEGRPDALAELTVLRERLDKLQRTGQFQRHPAAEYDDVVADALRRVAPNGQLLRNTVVSRNAPDFELVDGDRRVFIETKWRTDPRPAFRWATLQELLPALPPAASLLVITNSVDVTAAREQLSATQGVRIRVVSWNNEEDDDDLHAALAELLAL